jgi:hypothetical protein
MPHGQGIALADFRHEIFTLPRRRRRARRVKWPAEGGRKRKGRMFFFEKKNQKTFIRCPQVPAQAGAAGASRNG